MYINFWFAVCAALRARDLNGKGQKISQNLLDGQIATLANIITHYNHTKVPVRPHGGGHPQIVPYQPFLGKDNRYFILACLNDRFWKRLTKVIDRSEWADDPRYDSNPKRVKNRKELITKLSRIFKEQPSTYWLNKLDEAGVPCSPVNRLEDVLMDPQVIHNGAVTTLHHPEHGEYPVPNNPIKMHGTPVQPSRYAPRLGEHTREVLKEYGFRLSEIEELIKKGIVSQYDDKAANTSSSVK